jgi:UDP-galactopyranose mutase
MAQPFDFLVFSHLRWDFVFQRPQHLLSRFARSHRVIFIEEPIRDERSPHWEFHSGGPNVIVCRPHTPIESPGFNPEQLEAIDGMMESLIQDLKLENYVAWFYTPMALPLARRITPKAAIYDCMDELSAFLGAPAELIDRERELLKLADLVFTGGPSLYRAKQHRHPNVHCFPSSVDAAHYAKARPGMNDEAADQKHLPKPRIGYFGVIDERLDYDLIRHLATARPEWQIAMVGPVVKVNPELLPKLPNITWFGQRAYADLPSYISGWDVCMLPFARNRSTQFISPTKTLEYMAAERMIVSTPIRDVAEPYGHIVFLGDSRDEFVAACDRAMDLKKAARQRRIRLMREVLSRTSWDSTASRMLELIDSAVQKTGDLKEGVFVPAAATRAAGAGPHVVSNAWRIPLGEAQGD